ncbi:MAG: hemerythrin family protein [Spirochaetales bacterium]|nr:hemerythrin family protein [Spirochaetales bacterium]
MAFFDWDDKLSTGIPVIDEQHMKLVSFVNQLHEAMLQRKGKEVLGGIIDGLAKYTVYHFATEEKAFAAHGYDGAPGHVKAHKALLQRVEEIALKHARGELTVTSETLNFLIDWVGTHIMKEDKLYVPFLKDKPIEE